MCSKHGSTCRCQLSIFDDLKSTVIVRAQELEAYSHFAFDFTCTTLHIARTAYKKAKLISDLVRTSGAAD